MILDSLLSSDGYTPVNKTLAKDFGFVVAGFFGELIRQRKRFGSNDFYFSQKSMEDEIGISEHEQRQAVKILTKAGFLIVAKKGLPATNHFIILDAQVLEYLNDQCLKNGSTGAGKNEAHIIRMSNKNDNNIDKEIYSEIEKSKIIEENERTLTQSFLFYFTLLGWTPRKGETIESFQDFIKTAFDKIRGKTNEEGIAKMNQILKEFYIYWIEQPKQIKNHKSTFLNNPKLK